MKREEEVFSMREREREREKEGLSEREREREVRQEHTGCGWLLTKTIGRRQTTTTTIHLI